MNWNDFDRACLEKARSTVENGSKVVPVKFEGKVRLVMQGSELELSHGEACRLLHQLSWILK